MRSNSGKTEQEVTCNDEPTVINFEQFSNCLCLSLLSLSLFSSLSLSLSETAVFANTNSEVITITYF